MFTEFTGIQYIKIDVANNYGLDKKLFSDRIAWFDQNEQALLDMMQEISRYRAKDIESGKVRIHPILKAADAPALLHAGMVSYIAAKAGKPCGIMIGLDATASVLQLLSVMTGCRKSAAICNVIDTGKRADAYTETFATMKEILDTEAELSRDQVKDAMMPSYYGSKVEPRKAFGTNADGSDSVLLTTFHQTKQILTPGPAQATEELIDLWDPKAKEHTWELPDGFRVRDKVEQTMVETVNFLDQPSVEVSYSVNAPSDHGVSLAANTVHSVDGYVVREMARRCMYDPAVVEEVSEILSCGATGLSGADTYEGTQVSRYVDLFTRSGMMSARILDYIRHDNAGLLTGEAYNAVVEIIQNLPARPFKVLSIHD